MCPSSGPVPRDVSYQSASMMRLKMHQQNASHRLSGRPQPPTSSDRKNSRWRCANSVRLTRSVSSASAAADAVASAMSTGVSTTSSGQSKVLCCARKCARAFDEFVADSCVITTLYVQGLPLPVTTKPLRPQGLSPNSRRAGCRRAWVTC